jgi:hypothetical protein
MPAVFPIAYFGSISYYQKMVQMKLISFDLHEHYVKQTLRNRISILSVSGIQQVSIPVAKPNGNKTLTRDIVISNAENWRKLHWKAIESAYSSSPYFEHYSSEVKELIDNAETNLYRYNLKIHQRIVSWLQLPIKSDVTSSYDLKLSEDLDFRMSFNNLEKKIDYNYQQVFSPNEKFEGDLSILDAIFNLGPMARNIISND